MKKLISALLILSMLITGCAKKEETTPASAGAVISDVIDLTKLSSILVYTEVENMMMTPNRYLGKTVKMRGPYYANYYFETEKYYHYVTIEDALACCKQGLEFVLNGEHVYPDDYPKDNTEIEVTGVFGSYEELEETYYCIYTDSYTAK